MTGFLNRLPYSHLAIALLAALIAPSVYATKISAATAATAATAADAARTFELAEEISRNLKKSPSEFIDSWPGPRISTPNLKNEGTYNVSGGRLKVGDHLTAKNSSISISADKKNIESVLLSLEGSCISRQDFKSRYPNYLISNIPRGQSSSETLTLAVVKNQEKMEFSFPEASPDCLSTIRIAPADAQMLKAAEAFN
ncbi:hypothetical protein JWH11_19545 [Xanthomonas melonis]|uniref:Uncharacterized protein n=1 Tax=Xanthomonas melonis TaxID=56456 RepID=A0ABS8NZQ8_9XANT|nr:hypothetical protein [Xanthomonas melonis]MCD0260501.1 hypothetical protein [Xanthomonas melonis]MCD0268589.1 hypothetical protein [Xanthomonas melonis]